MARLSKAEKLPPEIRDEIARLRNDRGQTIDQILAHLRQLGVEKDDLSRSGLGEYVKEMDELAKDMRAARGMAEGLVKSLGDEPDDKLARLNIELLHGAIFKLQVAARTGKGDELTAGELQLLARSVMQLEGSQKTILERVAAAAVQATNTAREAGISAETVELIKARILGVAA